ncbi:MAG: hypothetical protein ACREIO_02390 [Nitrospiraceae bacterium]
MGSGRITALFQRRTLRSLPPAPDLGRIFRLACWIALSLSTPALAVELSSHGSVRGNDLEALREATRVLEEEIKLASRPRVYWLLDLPERVIAIKARGVELHRFPILAWRMAGEGSVAEVFRLRARPSVARPKATSGDEASQELIELQDMPAEYELAFDPPLTLFIAPPAHEQPWLWARSRLREWFTRVASWGRSVVVPGQKAAGPRLRLALSREAARSLAWSSTEGMPVVIKSALPP